jgi:hypothetical protein
MAQSRVRAERPAINLNQTETYKVSNALLSECNCTAASAIGDFSLPLDECYLHLVAEPAA